MARLTDMAKHSSDYIWPRGDQYWLKLPVPRKIQRKRLILSSNGNPRDKIQEPLGDSKSAANDEARYRVAWYTDVFRRIEAGLLTTPQQVEDAMRGPSEPDVALLPGFDAAMRRFYAERPVTRRMIEQRARWFERYGDRASGIASNEQPAARPALTGETITQAAEAWLAELTRDETTAPRDTTIAEHRRRVKAFVDAVSDLPLAAVTRAMASDFLAALKSNRTRNQYARTLANVFKSARLRGRYQGEKGQSPFDDQRKKVVGSSYEPFTVAELQTLFDAMPREVEPARHTPDTALPWVALIALYTGARLEEIAQLTTADVREESANGATVWCVDIHNGGENKLKSSARLIPVHSELVRLGFLDYVAALPKGPLFPGLKRRASKGNKVGARVGELFRKKLVALKLKRKGLCFHSFRHTVAGALDAAAVPQSDAARVLGHAVAGMSYGTYSQAGPGLKRVAAVVEQISYEGLRL
jgi:integrase